MTSRTVFAFIALVNLASALSAEVFVKDGDVYFKPEAAPPIGLSHIGNVQKAMLTPDGKWALYYTGRHGMIIDGGNGQAYFVDAHIVRTDGSRHQLLWQASPLAPPGTSFDAVIPKPVFAPDGSALYFIVENKVHRFDLQLGSTGVFCAGFYVDIIRKGPQAGYLLVMKSDAGGFPRPWLVDSHGKSVRPLLAADASLEAIKATISSVRAGGDLPQDVRE